MRPRTSHTGGGAGRTRPAPPRSPSGARTSFTKAARALSRTKILCGIPAYNNGTTIAHVMRAVEAGLRRYFPGIPATIVISDGGSTDGTIEAALSATTVGDEEHLLIDPASPSPQRLAVQYRGISGKGSAFRTLFRLAEAAEVDASAVFDADLRSISPTWVNNLVSPVLWWERDFVAPVYVRHRNDGTITNSIAYPLTAALYGRRIRQPIGGEFGFSGRLAARWSSKDVWKTDVARYGIDIWMTTVAITEGFRVCQAELGAKIHDPKDPGLELGPMFRQVVGSLFALAGRYVDHWWSVGIIEPVPTYGFSTATNAAEVRIRAGRLMWRFVEGYMRHEKVWRRVLTPETLSGVLRATDEAAERTEGFVLPAELWAHVVYDYLVAYNARVLGVPTLLDSMIPLYFARTATFVQETQHEDPAASEGTIAEYADLFLERKDYLRARWSHAGVTRSLDEQTVTPEGTEPTEPTADTLGRQTG